MPRPVRCIAAGRRRTVRDGPVTARVMIVGEQAGDKRISAGQTGSSARRGVLDQALADGRHPPRRNLSDQTWVKHFKYRRIRTSANEANADCTRNRKTLAKFRLAGLGSKRRFQSGLQPGRDCVLFGSDGGPRACSGEISGSTKTAWPDFEPSGGRADGGVRWHPAAIYG